MSQVIVDVAGDNITVRWTTGQFAPYGRDCADMQPRRFAIGDVVRVLTCVRGITGRVGVVKNVRGEGEPRLYDVYFKNPADQATSFCRWLDERSLVRLSPIETAVEIA